jgi:hypothetical protein
MDQCGWEDETVLGGGGVRLLSQRLKYLSGYYNRYLEGYHGVIALDIIYNGMRVEPTLSATRELLKEGKDFRDVLTILEEGYDCSVSKRKGNVIEKCLRKGKKEYKAVLVETDVMYPDGYTEKALRVIHFGKITYKEERRREQ